jgi:O-antigen/teichoic acid export membrane protein
MAGVPMLALLAFWVDTFVLKKVVPDSQLGLYAMALALSQMPCNLFSRVVSPILLPTFAHKQDDVSFLSAAVLRATKLIAVLGLPLLAVVSVWGGTIMSVIYGRDYSAAGIPFAVLCAYGMVRIQAVVLSSVYMGIGLPHLHRRFVVLRLLVLALLIYPAVVQFGLIGSAAAVLAANLIGLIMQVVWIRRCIELRISAYLRAWLAGVVVALGTLIPFGTLKLRDTATIAGGLTAAICWFLVMVLSWRVLRIGPWLQESLGDEETGYSEAQNVLQYEEEK